MDMEISEVFFWPQTEWGEVRAPVKFITLFHGPAYFIEPTQLLHHPACYVIQRNDLRQLL